MRKILLKSLVFSTLLIWPHQVFSQLAIISEGKNASLPVDIESDTLTVKPEQNQAIFKGKVKAVQGDMTLLADQMVVFYHESEKESDPLGGQLSKIEAYGNVVLTVPDKKAVSDKGKYDVDKSYMVLMGNVTLTQQGNKLKGEKFVYNVATGESKMESAKADAAVESGNNGQKTSTRVKGVFVPKTKPTNPDKNK